MLWKAWDVGSQSERARAVDDCNAMMRVAEPCTRNATTAPTTAIAGLSQRTVVCATSRLIPRGDWRQFGCWRSFVDDSRRVFEFNPSEDV
jgi:hypothetical protein